MLRLNFVDRALAVSIDNKRGHVFFCDSLLKTTLLSYFLIMNHLIYIGAFSLPLFNAATLTYACKWVAV